MPKHKLEFTKCPFCHGDANAFVGGNADCDCHGTGLMALEPGVGARRLAIDVERSIFGITYAPITEIDLAESKAMGRPQWAPRSSLQFKSQRIWSACWFGFAILSSSVGVTAGTDEWFVLSHSEGCVSTNILNTYFPPSSRAHRSPDEFLKHMHRLGKTAKIDKIPGVDDKSVVQVTLETGGAIVFVTNEFCRRKPG